MFDVARPYPPAPLLPVAAGLIAGITANELWSLSVESCLSVLLAAAVGFCVWRCRPRVAAALLLLSACATGGLVHGRAIDLPSRHISRYLAGASFHATVIGQLLQSPRHVSSAGVGRRRGPPERTKFLMQLHAAQGPSGMVPVQGLLEVTVAEPVFDLYGGDRVRVFGRLYTPKPPRNPGQVDWARIKRRQGIHTGMHCRHAEAVHRLPPEPGDWRRTLAHWRLQARTLLMDRVFGDQLDERSLLEAMILGRRSQMSPSIREAFRRTGAAHYLALSGMHVGLLGWFVWSVGRTAGLSGRAAAALTILALVVYAALVEPRASVIRATVLSISFCAGRLFRRPANSLNSVSAAAIILLIANPQQLFQPGFQLSFVVALAIPHLTPWLSAPLLQRLERRLQRRPDDAMGRRLGVAAAPTQRYGYLRQRLLLSAARYAVTTLCVSLTAWLAGTPLAAYHFNSFYTYGWPFTVLLLPWVFLTMLCGFAKLLLGLLWPGTAVVAGPALAAATRGLVWTVEHLAQAPAAAVDVPSPPAWWLAAYYGTLTAAARGRRRATPAPLRRRLGTALLALTTVLTSAGWLLPPAAPGILRLTLFDVGSGSATTLQFPNGAVYLYDAGSSFGQDVGFTTLRPALRQWRCRTADGIIISHPNYDHYSGLFSLCGNMPIRQVLVSPHFRRFCAPGQLDHQLLEQFQALNIPIRTLSLEQDGPLRSVDPAVTLQVLWPPQDLPRSVSANDTSVVVKVVCGGRSVLLTGDIDQYATEQLLSRSADLACDVLVLPHHGSVNPASARLLEAAAPSHVVVSRGRRGSDPAQALAQALAGRTYLSTAKVGAITIELDGTALRVKGFVHTR